MQRWPRTQRSTKDGSAQLVASHTRLFKGVGDDHELGSRAVVLQGQHHKQTRPRLDYQNQAAEVMLSTRGRSPHVDEMPPSSAPKTSPRRRGPFMASLLYIVAPARGSGDAAGDAAAHRAVAHPAHRRGEERTRARCHDGVDAQLRYCAPTRGLPHRQAASNNALQLCWPELFFSARAHARQIIDRQG